MDKICYPDTQRSLSTFPVVSILACLVGTGGFATSSYFEEKGTTGYSIIERDIVDSSILEESKVLSAQDNLKLIKDFLHPSIAALARSFGVCRPTIYAWQKGNPISSENSMLIANIAKACEVLEAANLGQGQELLRRKISNGNNLIESIKSGINARTAAQTLIDILTEEQAQREIIEKRLMNRKRKTVDILDVGLPHLDETA